MFRLRFLDDHPEEHTIHLAYNYQGFVGILLFEDGKWTTLKTRCHEAMSTCSSIVWLSDKKGIASNGQKEK